MLEPAEPEIAQVTHLDVVLTGKNSCSFGVAGRRSQHGDRCGGHVVPAFRHLPIGPVVSAFGDANQRLDEASRSSIVL